MTIETTNSSVTHRHSVGLWSAQILSGLTVWAALGLVSVQIGTMATPISLGVFLVLPINLVLLALAAFVAFRPNKTYPRAA
jgi:predicted membrane chloride channel (bestrophin family)